jgi:hypothetical protein
MKFPYGISDFHQVITEDYLYIDRSNRIAVLEEVGKQLLFLRPRRFGKSLLLSMLENYYDLSRSREFERLFGHLAIGQKPTPLHNHYLVMKWDFSRVAAQGGVDEIRHSLYSHINNQIRYCIGRYRNEVQLDVAIDAENALSSFESLLTAAELSGHRLYLLIDEYDNFANEVMMGASPTSRARYEALLYGEGMLKTLFKNVKAASAGRGLDRVFITGVSPVVLSDVTSGYNVAQNIYLMAEFSDLCGFHEDELGRLVSQVVSQCGLPEAETGKALALMRDFYNGYSFSFDSSALVYNPTLTIYFLEHFQRYCRYPENMLDDNLAMDAAKLAYIAGLPDGEGFLWRALEQEQPLVIRDLASRFGLEQMLLGEKDTAFIGSLLTYLGVLTLVRRTPLRQVELRIPNLVTRRLYVERLQQVLLPNLRTQDEGRQAARALYLHGNLQPLCDFMESRLFPVFDNRDYRHVSEFALKTLFLTLLFEDMLYVIDSEMELGRGYADLSLMRRPEMRQHSQLADIVIEFKLVRLADAGLAGAQAREASREQLLALPPVQASMAETRLQLARYRRSLTAKYGESLRLRIFGVVALGFERVVWEEVGAVVGL